MAHVKRTIPLHIRMARLKDVKQNLSDKKRLRTKYPDCIGFFPECECLIVGEKNDCCRTCPHDIPYISEEKKIGGKKMTAEYIENEIKKPSKKVVREERIKSLMAKPYMEMTSGEKAYIARLVGKGKIVYELPEKKKKIIATVEAPIVETPQTN